MSEREKNLLQKLKSSKTEEVYDSLLKIRKTYVKDCVKRKRFLQGAVIKTILSLIEHPKFANISLSIIADACLEKSILFEVLKNDGIKSLIRIMKSLVNDEIQNRACRALGNIAKSDEGFKAVHIMKPVSNIVNFLTGTQDANCQQTAVRTLRILGKNSKSRDIIVRENGIICIAKLLHSSHKDVLLCSTRALAELTMNCNVGCARQLLEMQSLKMLVELNNHTEKSIRTNTLTSLKNISSQDETRSDLIKAGALNLFTEVAGKCGSLELRRLAALALCNCLNYMHMWESYGVPRSSGLKSLLEVLRNKEMEDIHVHIVSSLLPLCYENAVADILLDLEIIQILSVILKNFIATNKLESHLPLSQTETLKDFPSLKVKTVDLNCTSPEIPSSTSDLGSFLETGMDASFSDIQSSPSVKANNFNFSTKYTPKFDVSSCFTFHSSGASSYCSPSSSGSYSAMSPKGFSDYNPGSPIRDPWSPNSTNEDSFLCWSPVLSCSDSSNFENERSEQLYLSEKSDDLCNKTLSATLCSNSDDDPISIPIVSNLEHESQDQRMLIEPDSHHLIKDISTDKSTDADSVEQGSLVKKHKFEIDSNENSCLSLEEGSIGKKSRLSSAPSNQELTDSSTSETYTYINEKCSIDYYVLSILMQFSYLDKKDCCEYASSMFFSILLDYVTSVKHPNMKAEKFLIKIIKNRPTFDKLIRSGFVWELETRLAPQHNLSACKRCSHLDSVQNNLLSALRMEAESDYGVGTLCHILSTSDKSSQMHVLYLSTKLITFKTALFRIIVQAKGLPLLREFLADASDLSFKAIISLCQLFQNLRKYSSGGEFKCCVSSTCFSKSPSKCTFKDVPTDVTFVIDGITVSACRETICHNSDYFSALLEGHFSESQKNVVTMCDISAETLTTIFHFLHGCNTLHSSCPYIKRIPFSILLELLHQSEKFLLSEVKTFVIDSLCHNLFHNTVSKIYFAAKQCNSPDLMKKALSFVLSTDITKKDILLNCFQDLMGFEKSCTFLADIHSYMEEVFSEYILQGYD